MADRFSNYASGLSSPATRHHAITPSDTVDLPTRPRALYCTGAGTASVMDEAGTSLTYTLEVGDRLEFRATRVMATGTTATLVGWE